MFFRLSGVITAALIGLGNSGSPTFAQYHAAPVYPSPQHGPTPHPPDAELHVRYRGDARNIAALSAQARPETRPRNELPPHLRRALIEYHSKEPAGTIIVDTPNTYLYLVLGNGKAMRYGIGVGRAGLTWSGTERVSRMAEWPDWNPPPQMIERQPYLPRFMAGGEGNPLGARTLYLGNTLYRIHGTNQPSTIGGFVSSGCIRLTNADVTDLYMRVKIGTRVVVRPAKPERPARLCRSIPPERLWLFPARQSCRRWRAKNPCPQRPPPSCIWLKTPLCEVPFLMQRISSASPRALT